MWVPNLGKQDQYGKKKVGKNLEKTKGKNKEKYW